MTGEATVGSVGGAGLGPFAGRSAELGRLEAVLERVAAGGSAVVDVIGDAGIGKSRLLTEFAARARSRGVTVLRGRATERARARAFRPFTDAFADLDQRTLRVFPALADLPAEVRGEPGGASAAGEVSAAGRVGGPAPLDHFGLFRATAAALGRVTPPGLAVVLDDLHWADTASLDLLDHLVRHPVRAPLLLVVSRRERQSPPAVESVLARGADAGAVVRIALGPLDGREGLEVLAPDLPAEDAVAIHAASGGYPLYFQILLQALRAGAPPGAPVPPCGVPVGPGAALLLDELAPLTPLERSVLEAVAVLGGHATTSLLGAVTGADDFRLVAALRQVVGRDLARPAPGGHRVELRHPLVRALVLASTDPWRRQELHRRAAAALALTGAPLDERAHHIEQSLTRWDPDAAAVLVEAAERSAASDPTRAARWLDIVLGLLPDTTQHLDRRCALMLTQARVLGMTGAVRRSRDLLHRLISLRRPAVDDDLRTSAVVLCAFLERHLGRYPAASALLRRELDRRPGPSPVQRTGLVVEWGCCALFANRFPEVREELARTLAEARARGDEAGEAELLTLTAMGEAYEGRVATAGTQVDAAAALVDVVTDGDLITQCESLVRLGWSEVFLERYADAERHAERGVLVARRAGRPFALAHLLLCSAYAHLMTGRVTAALGLADESVAVARALGGGELPGFTRAIRSLVLMHARAPGDPEVLAAAEEAAANVGAVDGWWATLARSLLAYAARGAGDPHRVRDVLLAVGGGRDLPRLQPSVRPNLFELLVESALDTGDTADAEYWAARGVEEARRLGLPAQQGAALRGVGLLEAHRGDPAAAARAFTEAAESCARSRATLREAQSLLLGAPQVLAAGDGSRAASMWRRGRRLAVDGGARLLVALADRTGVEVRGAVDGVPPGPAGRLAGLTPRERQISELIAEGLSNQAVASRLCLSTRTVESHVARVYRKTGVPSRAALASLIARGDGAGRW
ncbi:helix-turn-helix transcriptional regulator [Wenjunlia vitaminophila]|uniref:helix-turn-helix transcriptional regulator n=1 Tax=Wenjunlia vitaminophila TaxID=76728 RepID=UPI000AB08926|nr:AAA family ATPase [Wenjunlia vitaminophila]